MRLNISKTHARQFAIFSAAIMWNLSIVIFLFVFWSPGAKMNRQAMAKCLATTLNHPCRERTHFVRIRLGSGRRTKVLKFCPASVSPHTEKIIVWSIPPHATYSFIAWCKEKVIVLSLSVQRLHSYIHLLINQSFTEHIHSCRNSLPIKMLHSYLLKMSRKTTIKHDGGTELWLSGKIHPSIEE